MNTLEDNAAVAMTLPISEPRFEPEAKDAAPVLISEKEVLFGTAAAVPLRPTTTRRWTEATRVVVAAMHRMSLTSRADGRQPRQDYPRRYEFLERSCMGREMDRL
jgi:hypothetical protein